MIHHTGKVFIGVDKKAISIHIIDKDNRGVGLSFESQMPMHCFIFFVIITKARTLIRIQAVDKSFNA
jgi:hypothetical protein